MKLWTRAGGGLVEFFPDGFTFFLVGCGFGTVWSAGDGGSRVDSGAFGPVGESPYVVVCSFFQGFHGPVFLFEVA